MIAEEFKGKFSFPGTFAFLVREGVPDDALLQFDDPFTGVFDDVKARDTCDTLQRDHQSGDDADLTGKIVPCDVQGRSIPVLFLFD